jgi:hypothetical protein
MTSKELLNKLDTMHQQTAGAILKLREVIANEDKYTQTALEAINAEIIQSVQLAISEMEILSYELEAK